MADSQSGSILRRKLAAARVPEPEGGPGADRSWRMALGRAARDAVRLALDVQSLDVQKQGLSEVLEDIPERALISVLQGPGETLGVLVMTPDVLSSILESQTIGRVNRTPPAPRKPTRTDAAMTAGFIDAALAGLEQALLDEADLSWAGGFRYGSHLEDARPLGLLLEDREYRVLTAQVSLGLGQRSGQILLALPAEGPRLAVEPPRENEGAVVHAFAEALAERVDGASCMMLATLARVSLTLGDITELTEGMVLPLWNASIERIRLEGLDGRILGEGRLGQNRGMRAVRLAERPAATGRGAAAAPVQAVAAAPATGTLVPVPVQGGERPSEPARAAV